MKEELLKVLEAKLDSINKNIESLDLINTRLSGEEENLTYVKQILDYFAKEKEGYDINKFPSLNRDDFNHCMELVPETTKVKFETNSCNYDGLVYLINGINNGISLALTDEQKEAIELLINGLSDKKIDYLARIDGIKMARDRLEVSDGNVLATSKEKYQMIIDQFNNDVYVAEIDDVINAINYEKVEQNKQIEMLSYLLKYNADIYSSGAQTPFHSPTFDTLPVETNEVQEAVQYETQAVVPQETQTYPEQEMDFMPTEDYEEVPLEENQVPEEVPMEPIYEEPVEETVSNEVANADMVMAPAPLEVEAHGEMINKDALNSLLLEYRIKLDDEFDDSLLYGDINNYRAVLDNLRSHNILSTISKNQLFLKNLLIYSNNDLINSVLDIVRNDFSIDDEDYVETSKITIETLPSIFINEPVGNFSNFIRNVEMFRRLNFDMINLFDFSRELLVVDNNLLETNYQLVSRYELSVDEKNAKYLLAIPNVSEKIDYYIEAIYEDKITKKTFDGLNIVKMYPSKLDSVTDLTIKRLRYSSENGKKIFGSRENSISGEVANLKVDVLNIPDNYFETFFNNEFDGITADETAAYEQMILTNNYYDFVEDEVLQRLNPYRDGLRYNIDNIIISYNKVLRYYNILKNNNVDLLKALEFAVCYNLVITKDEYMRLKSVLNSLGGK